MKEQKTERLRVTYNTKVYIVVVNSVRYADALTANELKIGFTKCWLIFQNDTWQFVGDILLCSELKNMLVSRIAEWHQIKAGTEAVTLSREETIRTTMLLNALLNMGTLTKQIS